MVFGTIVIGEKLVRKIQLINKGALGTSFELMRMREFKKLGQPEDNSESQANKDDPIDGIEMGEVNI